eukprot:8983554-Pyramimonas_sp.AAC.1
MLSEVLRRCQAARQAWRLRGCFWASATAKCIRRAMFQAFVVEAALSGLSPFVIPGKFINIIDQTLGKFLRVLSKGEMSWGAEQGEMRCRTTRLVLKSWKIPRSARQLRVRRIRNYLRWARYPEDHHAVVSAVFGTAWIDTVPRLSPTCNICADSTPGPNSI